YIYGKKRLREIDRRIEQLSRRLDELIVVPPREDQPDRVYFGAWVELEDEDGVVSEYRIVGPDELDAARGCVSVDAPLGRALIGRARGDELTVERPKGTVTFVVREIRYRATREG
ncbi:MAG TPA: GreA/GreB family elongation factor, partial [Myxococcota bacterium]